MPSPSGAAAGLEQREHARSDGELKVGDFLQVMVDPDDPKRVAIDWTAFGT